MKITDLQEAAITKKARDEAIERLEIIEGSLLEGDKTIRVNWMSKQKSMSFNCTGFVSERILKALRKSERLFIKKSTANLKDLGVDIGGKE